MEITLDDERNICAIAYMYSCRESPFEDLRQEGYLAVLQAEKPEHKFYSILHAIQEAHRKGKQFNGYWLKELANGKGMKESLKDKGFEDVDNRDYLNKIMELCDFSPDEQELIKQRFYDDKVFKEIGASFDITPQGAGKAVRGLLIRMRHAMEKLEKDNV
jgi:DNA-directed RNA polymerase sigma subunit (sigma70/sigma32)